MPGGAVGPGVIVDLSRWNQIGEVDVSRRTVRAGPGAARYVNALTMRGVPQLVAAYRLEE